MKIKEINVNDMTAIIVAGAVTITALVVQPPLEVIAIGSTFVGVVAGYVGSRVLNNNEEV